MEEELLVFLTLLVLNQSLFRDTSSTWQTMWNQKQPFARFKVTWKELSLAALRLLLLRPLFQIQSSRTIDQPWLAAIRPMYDKYFFVHQYLVVNS
jgi:hypothetical protein